MSVVMKKAILSLSGGMDSSSLLIHLLAKGYEVKVIVFDYGQKHDVEIDRAKSLWNYLVECDVIKNHEDFHLVKMPLQDLLHSSLVKGGSDVPEGHYEEDNMKDTVVPNRNKIFSSIIQAAALSWAIESNSNVEVSMGIHSGDHNIYPDCRQSFRDADYQAFVAGNWDADKVTVKTPYLNTDKEGILRDGQISCRELGIEFDEVYSRTNTSYKPIKIDGVWHSDYKSASSVERIEAFINVGIKDPLSYANEEGIVSWDFAVAQVSNVLTLNTESNES